MAKCLVPLSQYPFHFEALSGQSLQFQGSLSGHLRQGIWVYPLTLLLVTFPSRPEGPAHSGFLNSEERGVLWPLWLSVAREEKCQTFWNAFYDKVPRNCNQNNWRFLNKGVLRRLGWRTKRIWKVWESRRLGWLTHTFFSFTFWGFFSPLMLQSSVFHSRHKIKILISSVSAWLGVIIQSK